MIIFRTYHHHRNGLTIVKDFLTQVEQQKHYNSLIDSNEQAGYSKLESTKLI